MLAIAILESLKVLPDTGTAVKCQIHSLVLTLVSDVNGYNTKIIIAFEF